MAAYLPSYFNQQFFYNGAVAAGQVLYVYETGTSTPKTVYTDQAGTIPYTQPIVLDANGKPEDGPFWILSGECEIRQYTAVLPGGALVDTFTDVAGVATSADLSTLRADLSTLRADLASTSDPAKGAGMVGADDGAAGMDFTTLNGLVNRIQAPNNAAPVTIATPPAGYVQYGNSCAGGINTLRAITGGTNNFSWGRNALQNATDVSACIAIGNDSLKTLTNGGNVIPAAGTFFGQGWSNFGIGETAGRDITTGYENMLLGNITGQRTTTGKWNVALGHHSLILNQTGDCNTVVGDYALTTSTQSNNTVMGWSACEVQTTGSNTVYGYVGMNSNTTGSLNSAFGANTLRLATAPINNCTFGLGTLENATVAPDSNSAFGTYAMGSTTGAPVQCGAFGLESLLNVTGNFNNGFGSQSLKALTSGIQNTGLGHGAGRALVSGDSNTAVGYLALSTANAAATNNTAVGANSLLAGTGDGNTALGSGALNTLTTETNCTGVGLAAAVTGSNQVQLGNSSTTTYAYGAVQNRSDSRDKTEIRDTVLGLEFITSLRPVDFKWDYREDYLLREKDGSKKRNRFHHGLIAQEVKAVIESSGVDFGGFQDHALKGGKDVLSVGYEELIGPLIKAVQELKAEFDVYKASHP